METQSQAHPSPGQLSAFALGKLKPDSHARVERHLANCETCAEFIASTPQDTFIDLLKKAVADKQSMSRSTPSLQRESTQSGLPLREATQSPKLDAKSRALSLSEIPAGSIEGDAIPEPLVRQSKYKILRLLGRGGMGSVYEAYHERMGRKVAIKVISPTLVDHPEALKRFDQEVRTAAQLNHPNVTRAYDADVFDDLRILVMEYIPGSSLDKVLAKNGPLSVADACRCVRQAALGLQHAHERGTVHRDLKPQNLMLSSEDKKVRILDFGLGKLASENQRRKGLTREHVLMGTPDYIAPEQALDAAKADIRADIYSLGCTLYCLLTGTPPFQADTEMKVLMAHQQEIARPLSEVRADVPQELSEYVAKMLSKDPADRPQTPVEVAEGLLPFAKGVTPASGKDPGIPKVTTERALDPAVPTTIPSTRSKPKWLIYAASSGLVLLFILGINAMGVFKVRTPTGIIEITGVPVDAEVFVDGQKVTLIKDADTATIESVPMGSHHLKIVQAGQTIWTSDATLAIAGDLVHVSIEQPVPGLSSKEGSVARRDQDGEDSVPDPLAHLQRAGVPPAITHGGAWVVTNEEIRQTFPVLPLFPPALVFGDPEWDNYDFEFEFINGAPDVEGRVHVLFNGEGTKRFRTVAIQTGANLFPFRVSYKNYPHNGSANEWAKKPVRIVDTDWHQVRLEIRGTQYRCFLDGDEILTENDPAYRQGRLGISTTKQHAQFRNLKVTGTDGKILWAFPQDLVTIERKADQADTNARASQTATDTQQSEKPPLADAIVGVAETGESPNAKDRITNSLGMQLIHVAPGEFLMGSHESGKELAADFRGKPEHFKAEFPQHKVRLTNPFYVGATEVTQAQWHAVMGTKPWLNKNRTRDAPQHPATYVSYADALLFCQKLTAQERMPTSSDIEYRLPSEAEWEYCCRAGNAQRFCFGNDKTKVDDYAWFSTNAAGNGNGHAQEVAQKKPNAWGLYDMHGNVQEWCLDWFAEDYYSHSPVDNPMGPALGSHRVVRGGIWTSWMRAVRSSFRDFQKPEVRNHLTGFRVVRNSAPNR